ncbi:MAG: GDSL-type esterase/lipase family protein [Verrucomicrobiota bacterium]
MRTLLSLRGLLLAGWFCASAATAAQDAATNPPHHLQWEKTIRAFEAADITNPPPQNAILLIGSSSIRKWTNAPGQFPDHRLINRGFGGSHLSDSVAFIERIVIPYQPRLVLLYAGDNDIAAGKSPAQVFADFKEFVAKVQGRLPQTRIAFIAIKPSPSRMPVHRSDQNRKPADPEFHRGPFEARLCGRLHPDAGRRRPTARGTFCR